MRSKDPFINNVWGKWSILCTLYVSTKENRISLLCTYRKNDVQTIGILQFTLLMWRHIKKQRGKRKLRKPRLLSITKREENRIEL